MRRVMVVSVLVLAACRFDDGREGARSSGVGLDGLGETAAEVTAAQDVDPEGLPPVIVCTVDGAVRHLPAEIRESSGLARGRRNPALFWTHNDAGNPPDMFALDAEGNLIGRVRLDGAASDDWEDVESGQCPEGDCLFVADVGDNDGEREFVTIYRIPEPDGLTEPIAPTAVIRARFPDGSQDAEALFALRDGSLYIVTKGRSAPITLYRVPTEAGQSGVVVLQRIRDLLPAPANERDRVTAATATPDGRWVVLRTYRSLLFYPAGELVAGRPIPPTVVDLGDLGHPQGEAVAMGDDGSIWLTSEAEGDDSPPLWSRLKCDLPARGATD